MIVVADSSPLHYLILIDQPARFLWALLLARIYEILPLPRMLCGAEMRIIGLTHRATCGRVRDRMLTSLCH